MTFLRVLLFLCCVVPALITAQPLRQPLIFPEAATEPAAETEVEATITRMRNKLHDVARASISVAEKRAAYEKLLDEEEEALKQISIARGSDAPRTVEDVVQLMELMFYEVALESAQDKVTARRLQENAPAHLQLEPLQPILIAPRHQRKEIVVTRDAEATGVEPWWRHARVDTEALALGDIEESPDPPVKQAPEEEKVKVEFAKDEAVTVEMHDDTTVLREVEGDDGDLVLFDALHLWVGGAVQLGAFTFDELFNASAGGQSKDGTSVRRGEVIVRSTLFDWGELKLQYDLDSNVWRDLYYRRVDEENGQTLTIGNQKEPLGLDFLMGNKFGTAMERSAPTTAFGSFRGAGIRFNRWFDLSPDQQFLQFADQRNTFVTATLGLFGQDIENTTDTDLALTGRVTFGRGQLKGEGTHIGLSASYRQGEYDRINPRAEVFDTNRILLAHPDADDQLVVALESMVSRGSLHGQAEFYYSDYRGGDIDGQGYGGYVQGGWFITGEKRAYRPKWGLWAPLPHSEKGIFEVFARLSYTYGDDDLHSSKALTVATLGGNWYLRRFRASLNALYSEVDRDYRDQDSGLAATVRLQYLF